MSNPKNPIITFRINFPDGNEQVGPMTNLKSGSVLHPDMFTSDADTGRAASVQHKNLKSTFIPGLLTGENVVRKQDGTFVAYGMKAKYIKDTYTTGANPLLVVVSETFESA